MPRWTCPRCDREFGRAQQSHTCVPGCTVDATFAGRPPQLRAVYDAIFAYVRGLGPVHEDAVGVGVFLKRDRKLAEVRPRSRDVACPDEQINHAIMDSAGLPAGRMSG